MNIWYRLIIPISLQAFLSQSAGTRGHRGWNLYLSQKDDSVWYTHRGHGICEVLSKGLPLNMLIAEHLGRATGSCHGLVLSIPVTRSVGYTVWVALLGRVYSSYGSCSGPLNSMVKNRWSAVLLVMAQLEKAAYMPRYL